MQTARTRYVVLAVAVLMLFVTACAARGPRNQVQVAAYTVGNAVHDLRTIEAQLYTSGISGYGKAEHEAVLVKLRDVLVAAQTFERAAAAIPEGGDVSSQLTEAERGLARSLDALAQAVPSVERVRVPLARSINVVRAALGIPTAEHRELPPVQRSEIPVADIQALLLVGQAIATAFARWKKAAQAAGVTPEQFAELDAMLTGDIAAIDAELHGDKTE